MTTIRSSGDSSSIESNVATSGWVRGTWLLGKRELVELAAFWLGFVAIGWAVGEWVLRPGSDTAVTRFDTDVAEWFVDRRTPTLNDWSHFSSMLADTLVKVVVTAIIAGAMITVWKRWLEPTVVAVTLVLEAMAFITITYLVARPRPEVARLEGSPVDSSFPSGHVAAAAAYGAIVVVTAWHLRRRIVITALALVVMTVVVLVGLARMYRGMHYFSDVIAGVVLGVASITAVTWVLTRAHRRRGLDDVRVDSRVDMADTTAVAVGGQPAVAVETRQ